MNKIYKPGECVKYIHVELHPVLADAWYCADIRREVTAVGAHVDTAPDICDPALVLWSRRIPAALDTESSQLQLAPTKETCDRALYVQCAESVAELVASRGLATHVCSVRDIVGCAVTLVVFGVKDYFKSTGRKTQNSNRNVMTDVKLEMAITDLLVSAGCDAVIVNTPNELALLVVQFTKAIAESPYKKAKRECDEQAEFYMRGVNKQCVAIDKNGNGKSRLWQQMVAILPQSSLETSRAICAQYKTPKMLYEALQTQHAVNEIADIGVARAGVPDARSRRVGPEFARRLQILFSAEDGDVLVE
ncbi:crossover junction endonuclease EME1 [Pectinophora gossypiella]|uniref:crossover junction endonuclease EME1 n=1 Tax=Pectinophora gossypiella TaxID=13191 RepID=UPI00214EDF3C|nr:crossover junction endonuclease EME1 [Pectinophora gossypiella]